MKWNPRQLEDAAGKGLAALPPVILVYGDDGGLVRSLVKKAAAVVCPTDDPFLVDSMNADDIKNTPSLLLESAQTIGFGGTKLIKVDAAHADASGNTAVTNAVKSLLAEEMQSGADMGVVVVIAATGIDAKSAMAKAVEGHKQAAAVRCFLDSGRDLATVINEKLAQSGQSMTPEARQFLIDNLGNDRGITESELDKLMIYSADASQITLEDCLEVIAAAPSVTVFKLCDAIGLRDRQKTDAMLHMLQHEGVDGNMMLAMVARHLRRLLECQKLCNQGMNPQQAMMKLRPPVFMGKDEFQMQLRRYPMSRLENALERLYQLQADSRKGVHPSDDVIHRGLLALSA